MQTLLSIVVGIVVFFLWYHLFIGWFFSFYRWLEKKKEAEELGAIRTIGKEINKLDADFSVISNNFVASDDKSISREENLALMNLYIACLEYKIPYIYVAQKNGNRLILKAYSDDFKGATIELD